MLAAHAPVPLARAHLCQKDDVDAVGLNRAFLEGPYNVVVAAGYRQLKLCHRLFLCLQSRQRAKCVSPRRTSSFSAIAIAARMPTRPSSLVGSKFCVNMLVK